MTGIPWLLFREWTTTQGLPHLHQATTGVGMVFLPPDPTDAARARELIEGVFIAEGLTTLGWRVVPCHSESLGAQAGQNKPQIEQVLVRAMVEGDALERLLYLVRKRIHQTAGDLTHCSGWAQNLYICSLSNRTIVYKGMVRSAVLSEFYTDLQSPAYTSPFAIFHRRFSTNTLPKWSLAQPMRLLSHNGEINTLLGNVNWMVARQADLRHEFWAIAFRIYYPL
jgi:glutamate synthase (ferredoxin)